MPPKPELPSVAADLAPAPKRRNLSSLQPRDDVSDTVIEENSRSIGAPWRASTQLRAPEEEEPMESIRIDIPEYVGKQLKLKVVDEGGTKAHYFLRGLAAIGFKIDEKDLRLDRRRRSRK
jgi:hypothetical protein